MVGNSSEKPSTELYLAGNNSFVDGPRLGDADALLIRDWLTPNHYVTGLDLRYNQIANEGARCIAQLLLVSDAV